MKLRLCLKLKRFKNVKIDIYIINNYVVFEYDTSIYNLW